jgi:hypothetical protein
MYAKTKQNNINNNTATGNNSFINTNKSEKLYIFINNTNNNNNILKVSYYVHIYSTSQQKIKALYDQQNTIQSYSETHLDLWSPTLGMCRADDSQHHPEIPIKNTTSKSRRSVVCEQPYAPQ